MGVYIKDMKMPKSCCDCDVGVCICNRYYDPYFISTLSERHPDCPLVEVKAPHGRLIDANHLSKMWFTTSLDNEDAKEWVQAFQDSIKFSRTAIEAEEKDDD